MVQVILLVELHVADLRGFCRLLLPLSDDLTLKHHLRLRALVHIVGRHVYSFDPFRAPAHVHGHTLDGAGAHNAGAAGYDVLVRVAVVAQKCALAPAFSQLAVSVIFSWHSRRVRLGEALLTKPQELLVERSAAQPFICRSPIRSTSANIEDPRNMLHEPPYSRVAARDTALQALLQA